MTDPLLNRVVLRNYKSIATCSVRLGPLALLVGPNGSGKSNFLDALRFVADSLRTSLDHALRDRCGINEVRRRSGGHPTHFGIRLEFTLESNITGNYAFRIAAQPQGGFSVQIEECVVHSGSAMSQPMFFRVRDAEVESSVKVVPAASTDRLFLVAASGLPEFRPVYEALSNMGFYNLNPDVIRDLQSPDAGTLLARDGRNLASVLARMDKRAKERVEQYLEKVVPGVKGVDTRVVGPKETIEFRQEVSGSRDPWRFLAANMSDGTLRALGILVALFQSANGNGRRRVPLIGIEEPETALHPRAAGLLLDSLREASRSTQVLVTSHSPDLLDNKELDPDSVLAVVAEAGATRIGRINEVGRKALRDQLYTAGELLRLDQVAPEPASDAADGKQLQLFDRE